MGGALDFNEHALCIILVVSCTCKSCPDLWPDLSLVVMNSRCTSRTGVFITMFTFILNSCPH